MKRLSDRAIEIINELHTERLDYNSEYLPLIDAAQKLDDLETILGGYSVDRLRELIKADREGRIDQIPSADVAPVVHAKWVFNGICTSCSACGSNKPTKAHDHKLASREVRFCYFCGAKMDLEESK